MNIQNIFELVEKLGISPMKLLEGLKPYLVKLKDPLHQAIVSQEKERGNRCVYILYNEYDSNGEPTGRLLAQFNDITEEGLKPFEEYPFEQLILHLLTPNKNQESKELPPSKS